MRRIALAALLCGALGASAPADIEVRQVTLGLPGEADTGSLYRFGSYSPVAVEMVLAAGESRNILLHIEQSDVDGDNVYSEVFTALSPGESGPSRVFWLYFVPNPDYSAGSEGFRLQVLDADSGEPLEVVFGKERLKKIKIPDLPEPLSGEHYLVLVVAEGTTGYVKRLSDYHLGGERKHAREVRIAHVAPGGLPNHRHGLEMVDAIVWDAAAPAPQSGDKQQAIIDWVRQGGRLLITAAGTAPLLADSRLAEILPVTIEGLDTVRELPFGLSRLAWDRDRQRGPDDEPPQPIELADPVQIAQCTPRPGVRDAIRSLAGTRTFMARHDTGNGSVLFSAITFKDLFDNEVADPEEFFRRALLLRRHDATLEEMRSMSYPESIQLINHLRRPINFQTGATVYLVIIIVFVFAYGFVATFGTWFVLRRRRLQKFAWPVFGVVAIAASVLSLGAVRVNAGLGWKLDQLTVVDSTVGTFAATARCYFGLKTSTMDDVDVWLKSGYQDAEEPGEQPTACFLRAMPTMGGQSSRRQRFADTQRYRARPTRAALDGVPIRATLKQFEGWWQGDMPGHLKAEIRAGARRSSQSRLLSGSSLTNRLGYDLVDCFLFEALLPPEHGSPRNSSILVHYIPRLTNGQEVSLDELLLIQETFDANEKNTLGKLHKASLDGLSGSLRSAPFARRSLAHLGAARHAALLLTTFSEYVPEAQTTAAWGGSVDPVLLQTNARWLDRSRDIRPDQLLLVGFSEEPGPVRLRAREGRGRYAEERPRRSLVVHRFTIPLAQD